MDSYAREEGVTLAEIQAMAVRVLCFLAQAERIGALARRER